jgi:hypothetical protein
LALDSMTLSDLLSGLRVFDRVRLDFFSFLLLGPGLLECKRRDEVRIGMESAMAFL